MDRDYYQILGVSEDASQEQIKAAYRRLAFQYHPDRNKEDTAAAEKMKEINEAYAILSNQAKRKEYDTFKDSYGSFASQRYRQRYLGIRI
jgi:curved DNA-binding protein CbpA